MELPGLRTQNQNLIRIESVLGKDALFVSDFQATLAMSAVDYFKIDAYPDTLHNIQPKDIIGTACSIEIIDEHGEPVYYHAYVTHFKKKDPSLTGQATQYVLELSPWHCFLKHESDSRIFQNKTVAGVLQEILQPYRHFGKFKIQLHKQYTEKRYQVQYNETNLDFFHRLCHYN